MAQLEAATVLFLCSGLVTLLSFVLVMVFRVIQYRTYAKGKYYGRFARRSVLREVKLALLAFAGVCVSGFLSDLLVDSERLGSQLLTLLSVTIGLAAMARMILIGTLWHRNLKSQLRRFGVRYSRDSVMTGPVRHVTVYSDKIHVDKLDFDDSLPD
ncbi:MAG: hypothetical protein ACREGE_01080 [Candidatus Microsaccharimonas sp.]